MAASKYARSTPPGKSMPRTVRLDDTLGRVAASLQPVGDPNLEKVLAEVRHELGNFFHKLYYWSEHLKERPPAGPADATATQMLDRTIHSFETFLHGALDYFHPVELTMVPVTIADLRGAVAQQARAVLADASVDVAPGGPDDALEARIDPGRCSQLLGILLRRLAGYAGPASRLTVALERVPRPERGGIAIHCVLHEPDAAAGLFQTSIDGVEWALAEKLALLHGGELLVRQPDDATRAHVLVLPLVTA